MTGARFTLDATTRTRQAAASDPRASAWVSANAGSGKTHVLVRRVKRLLLEGVDPGRILCLTFTRAAAANMSNRVLSDVARWVAADDERLTAELAEVTGRPPAAIGRNDRAAARRVFARALETPGGLKIQTIHAFCEALLHQFPFEAGVAAGFAVLDDVAREALLADAKVAAARAAAADPGGVPGRAFATLLAAHGEGALATAASALGRDRAALDTLLPAVSDRDAVYARYCATFDVSPGDDEAAIDRDTIEGAALRPERWRETITALAASGRPRDGDRAEALALALAADDPALRAGRYTDLFLTQKGTPIAEGSVVTSDFRKAYRVIAEALDADHARIPALLERRRAVALVEVSVAALVAARCLRDHVEAVKTARGLLDFDDQVARTAALLASPAGPWVRWKLDRGIEHVLVDEAQDTSADQWRIVRALTEEFFAGEGASPQARTVFAVGDEKQSIFSFQGADPGLFDATRRDVSARARAAGARFEDVPLTLSFRSAPVVLDAVDAVFRDPDAARGLTASGEAPAHGSARPGLPGRVEIWPLEPRPEKRASEEPEGWSRPFDEIEAGDPRIALANRVARFVRDAIGRRAIVDGGAARPLDPGDVLILVRKRGALFDAIIRALKNLGVPAAGADRLSLTEHIAVMDLIALGDAVLLPEDDLVFAALLKSPLLGLDEDDLFALAAGRGDRPLVAELARRAGENPRFSEAHRRFAAWRARADLVRPFEFYAEVLGPWGGRKAFRTRLGREALDAVDAFHDHALAHEATGAASLQRFLAVLRDASVDVKREMSDAHGEVRVMTAHGAKGLEAKLVILPDTVGRPSAPRPRPVLTVPAADGGAPLLVWSRGAKHDAGPAAAARAAGAAADTAEHGRLLYVALTRAEQHLVICGHEHGQAKAGYVEGSWYDLVRRGLAPRSAEERDATGALARLVFEGSAPPAEIAATAVAAPLEDHAPAWASAPPPPAPARRRVLAPSEALEAGHDGAAAGAVSRVEAIARGEVLHRLLQSLPEVAPRSRRETALAFALARLPHLADALVEEAMAALDLPELAPFLAPEALAEVPVAGEVDLPDGRRVAISGQIDRLAVGADTIHLLDYKTGVPPADGRVPEPYAAQIGLYRAALRAIFPGRTARAGILWTRVPRFDVVADAEIDAALARLPAGD